MPTATAVLAVARTQLGTSEYPPGSNRCRYTAWYGFVGPWCAIFVSWVAAHSGATSVIPRHAYTPAGVDWFRSHGQYRHSPMVGDVVYYRWPNMGRVSHCGIVEAVNSDGSITAIEGNTDSAGGRTGGKVMRQRRSRYIDGYGRPKYTSDVPPPVPSTGDDFEMMGVVEVTGKAAEFLYTGTWITWIQSADAKSRILGEYKKQTGKDIIYTKISSQAPIQDGAYGWLPPNAPDPTTAGAEAGWNFAKHRKMYAKP